jgi:hypothetical protein
MFLTGNKSRLEKPVLLSQISRAEYEEFLNANEIN